MVRSLRSWPEENMDNPTERQGRLAGTTPVFCLWEETVKNKLSEGHRESGTDMDLKLRSQP